MSYICIFNTEVYIDFVMSEHPIVCRHIIYLTVIVNAILNSSCFHYQEDPTLEEHRRELIVIAGRALDKARMIRFDERTGYMYSTDLGRTASHFYIKFDTVEARLIFTLQYNILQYATTFSAQ